MNIDINIIFIIIISVLSILFLVASVYTFIGTRKIIAERKAKADLNNKTP